MKEDLIYVHFFFFLVNLHIHNLKEILPWYLCVVLFKFEAHFRMNPTLLTCSVTFFLPQVKSRDRCSFSPSPPLPSSSSKDMFVDFLERKEGRKEGRKREGERNIGVRKKHQSVASPVRPDQGLNPQPKYVP